MDEREGSANIEQPGLAVNWAFSFLCIVIYVSCSVYTQWKFVKLKKEGVVLQILDHPHLVSAELIILLVIQLPLLLNRAAGIPSNCAALVLVSQICLACVPATTVFRTLSFTKRISQVQCYQQFVFRGTDVSSVSQHSDQQVRNEKYQDFVRKVARALRGRRVHYLSLGTLIFGTLLAFIVPQDLVGYGLCRMRSLVFVLIPMILFTLPYFIFLKRFYITDPFEVLYKLKIRTVAAILTVACMMLLFFSRIEERVGTSNSALIFHKFLWMLAMTIWYIESYSPLRRTLELQQDTKNENGLTLIHTLSDPTLLRRFAKHLIKEWSIENLDFLKASLLHQFESTRSVRKILHIYKKISKKSSESRKLRALERIRNIGMGMKGQAWQIYSTYVANWAITQVTLGNSISIEIHEFFVEDRFLDVRLADDLDSNATGIDSTKLTDSSNTHGRIKLDLKAKELLDSNKDAKELRDSIETKPSERKRLPNPKPDSMTDSLISSNMNTETKELVPDTPEPFQSTNGSKKHRIVVSFNSHNANLKTKDKYSPAEGPNTQSGSQTPFSIGNTPDLSPHQRVSSPKNTPTATMELQRSERPQTPPPEVRSGNSNKTGDRSSYNGRTVDHDSTFVSFRAKQKSFAQSTQQRNRIKKHDTKAFCKAVAEASMEDFDESTVKKDLKATVNELKKIMKYGESKLASTEFDKEMKRAMSQVGISHEETKEGSQQKWAWESKRSAIEIMGICEMIMECTDVFDKATASVMRLLESDSHRRFAHRMAKERKTVV